MTISLLPLQALAEDKAPEAAVVNPFTDVAATDWYYDSVLYAYQHGLFGGTGEKSFSPNGTMTRAMYVTVMGRMAEIDLSVYNKAPAFTDVAAGSYYAPYVQWAMEKGITSGTASGLFDPDGFVTRQQMATFIMRYFDAYSIPYPEPTNSTLPRDLDLAADWAKDAVLKLWACGLFVGDSAGNFNPGNNATRAEAATFFMRTAAHLIHIGAKKDPTKTEEPTKTEDPAKTEEKTNADPGTPSEDGTKTYSVTFQDGERFVDRLSAAEGKALGAVPAADKTAKENAIFVGWFTDKALTTPFYYDSPVASSMTVYAKYADMPGEALTLTSFAQLDQSPDLSFGVVKTAEAAASPDNAFTLVPKDGSDLIPLQWTADGEVYTVTAEGGYNKGSSYELNLADGYHFKDKPDSIRTASFSIRMDKVDHLQMNDGIVYIQDTAAIDYTIDGQTYETLTPSLIPENGGTFTYTSAGGLQINDILCFYITTSPKDRDYISTSYNDDPEVYAKVESIAGTTVTFGALDEDDRTALYKVPDNFPIFVSTLPSGDTGTVNISGLDTDTYALIMGADGTLDYARENLNAGDFISLYVSSDSVTGEDAVYFGEVTDYDKASGDIIYKKTTAQAIENSMDLYISPEISGDDLITPEEKAAIENQLFTQVQASNFAEDAAFMLADMATGTDGFRHMDSVQSVFFKDENGKPLSEEEIALLNLGGSFELTDDIKLTVELVTSGDQLHFSNGVQLAIGIDAAFKVETADGGNIVIELSAVFVEEVELGINVKGDLVWKKVLGFIPVPIGVTVSAAVDIKNFTAVSFQVNIYTVAAEDEPFWEKLKGLLADSEVGKLLDQIEEVQNKIDQAKGTAEQLKGYAQDLEALWGAMPEDGTSKEEWAELGKTLGKTNITKDLMDMLNLTTETSLEAGIYAKSMQDLMEKYSEMLRKETDWVKLVDHQMFGKEMCFYGIAINAHVNFVVRADINIAMGTSLEYEVGKRYTFWFKVGLFKPKAGSETMDLLDERFAFQFYVMGKMGIKMGVAATIEVGIGSTELASIGITAELGPYIKLYGFFIYEYEKTKPANTGKWLYEERMAGALYLEFGLYFILTFDAQALGGLFEYSHDFFNTEIPLLKAGEKRYPYAFAYEPQNGEQVRIADEDNNGTNGITMNLPDSLRALSYVDLDTGVLGSEPYDYNKYNVTFSNPNFSMDKTGKIFVNVPKGVQYMESDVTFTWLYGKLAFSQYDMTVTIPLVWTNLNTAELNEYFTASVRVGNDHDGYQTIWSKRIKKNQEFDLPTMEAVKKLINYGSYDNGSGVNMKYESFSDYGSQAATGLRIYDDKVYDIVAAFKDYSVTVSGIEQPDGTKTSKTYTTQYGKAFDFTDLAGTGTNKPSDIPEDAAFTRFAAVAAGKEQGDIGNGEIAAYDLTAPVEGKFAIALAADKVNPVASYVDDSVLATFQFNGIEYDDVIQKLKKGTEPNLAAIEEIVSGQGLAVTDISPAFGKLFTNTILTVTCEQTTGKMFTLSFEENGGNEVTDLTKEEGSLIGVLPAPVKLGYIFAGWYADADLATAFGTSKMPSESITLYAKWTAASYTVTLNATGGTFGKDESVRVISATYGNPYGDQLASPAFSGKYFSGWFTELQGGTKVKADTKVKTSDHHTLYAQWNDLQTVSDAVYSFTPVTTTYAKGITVPASYHKSEDYAEVDGFTFEYRKQGDPNAIIDIPVDAGVYDLVIKRAKDDTYAQFEDRHEGVVIINKAVRTLDSVPLEANRTGYTFLDLRPADNAIDDLSDKAAFTYKAVKTVGGLLLPGETGSSNSRESYIGGLLPDAAYYITIKVTDDPNYEDAASNKGVDMSTLAAPTTSWGDHTEAFAVTDGKATITTAGQLAYLAKQVNSGTTYRGVTITLVNDIDLTGHRWVPIGRGGLNLFKGIFDGGNRIISGLYYAELDNAVGLFGGTNGATIRNVRFEESYIKGLNSVGGIVGYADSGTFIQNCSNGATIVGSYAVGGIAGYQGGAATIDNCVNYGSISGETNTGGIAGYSSTAKNNMNIMNCVNYGSVTGLATGKDQYHTGGISGFQSTGILLNSANFGSVTGVAAVGGVIGQNDGKNAQVLNSFTVGTVKGTGNYVGAVVGRNEGDDGDIFQSYYLAGSATRNGASRNAAGTEKGSLADGAKGTQTASFTSPEAALSRDCGYGATNLKNALNRWVTDAPQGSGQGASEWVSNANGYPVPAGLPQR
jgi:uncharacterized repeat protein (TIGR02543 family)